VLEVALAVRRFLHAKSAVHWYLAHTNVPEQDSVANMKPLYADVLTDSMMQSASVADMQLI
jgi:hypothetical protein